MANSKKEEVTKEQYEQLQAQYRHLIDVEIPIPSIKTQQYIVNIYTVYQLRKEICKQLKAQIKELCPILIKGSLEEGEV